MPAGEGIAKLFRPVPSDREISDGGFSPESTGQTALDLKTSANWGRMMSGQILVVDDHEVVRRGIRSCSLRDQGGRFVAKRFRERSESGRRCHALLWPRRFKTRPKTQNMAAKYTEEGMELVQQLSQEIRTMSYLLRPPLLDELDWQRPCAGIYRA